MPTLRNFALWVIIVLMLLALFTLFQNPSQRTSDREIAFSQFLAEVDAGRVRDVLITGSEIRGTFTSGGRFQTIAPNDPTLIQRLYGKGVVITANNQQSEVPWFVSLALSWLPFIALIGVWVFLSRQMQPASGKAGHPDSEVAALKRQIEDLKREIERLKESHKSPG